MKYFFLTGERSGDMHAANLAAELKILDPGFSAKAFGGEKLQQQGVEIVCGLERLSFMGFWEVVRHLWTILQNFRIAKKSIAAFQPDVVVLVDNPGFNMRMAKWCKKHGFKTVYYILPQVWAWHTGRIYQLKETCDQLIGILPFEKAFYSKHGVDMEYAEHPLLDIVPAAKENQKEIIALLPGSRPQELKRLLPDMMDTAKLFPGEKFIIAGLSSLKDLYPASLPVNVQMAWDDTYSVLSKARAAVVCSGTATLETALFNVPQVVIYKTGFINAIFVRLLAKVRFASLPNLIAGERIVPELLQDRCTPEKIAEALKIVLEKEPAEIYQSLTNQIGGPGAAKKASGIIYGLTR